MEKSLEPRDLQGTLILMKKLSPWSLVAVLSVLLFTAARQNSTPPARPQQQQPPAAQPGKAPPVNMEDMGAKMIEAIKGTEGCLGVSTGQLSENRNAIFAFFENKEAAMRWYNHPMHTQLRGMMGEGAVPEDHVPMKDVPDGVPILAVAALSFAGEPAMPGSQIPFSAISIELYAPVSGGLRINGGFAPDKFAELVQEKGSAKAK